MVCPLRLDRKVTFLRTRFTFEQSSRSGEALKFYYYFFFIFVILFLTIKGDILFSVDLIIVVKKKIKIFSPFVT